MILAFLIGSFVIFFLELSVLSVADWGAVGEIMRGYLFRDQV